MQIKARRSPPPGLPGVPATVGTGVRGRLVGGVTPPPGMCSREKCLRLRFRSANTFYSVGQANQKGLEQQHGNANTEIVYHDLTSSFHLNVYIPPEPVNKTGRRRQEEEWVTVPLEIPARYWNLLFWHLLKGEAYTVRVVRKDGRFECFISFPLGDTAPVDKDSFMAGIDLNPEVVAVTVASPNGNFKASRCFWCAELVHVSHEKREWLAEAQGRIGEVYQGTG